MRLSWISTFMSLTQALSTLRRVLVARLMAILTASSKLWSEIALISVTRATVIRYSFLRLSLKDFLPLHFGFANASVIPVYLHIGLVVPLGLFPHRWCSLGTRPVPTWPTTCIYPPTQYLVQAKYRYGSETAVFRVLRCVTSLLTCKWVSEKTSSRQLGE